MPLSNAKFEAYIGNFIKDTENFDGKAAWGWTIETMHGFKP